MPNHIPDEITGFQPTAVPLRPGAEGSGGTSARDFARDLTIADMMNMGILDAARLAAITGLTSQQIQNAADQTLAEFTAANNIDMQTLQNEGALDVQAMQNQGVQITADGNVRVAEAQATGAVDVARETGASNERIAELEAAGNAQAALINALIQAGEQDLAFQIAQMQNPTMEQIAGAIGGLRDRQGQRLFSDEDIRTLRTSAANASAAQLRRTGAGIDSQLNASGLGGTGLGARLKTDAEGRSISGVAATDFNTQLQIRQAESQRQDALQQSIAGLQATPTQGGPRTPGVNIDDLRAIVAGPPPPPGAPGSDRIIGPDLLLPTGTAPPPAPTAPPPPVSPVKGRTGTTAAPLEPIKSAGGLEPIQDPTIKRRRTAPKAGPIGGTATARIA